MKYLKQFLIIIGISFLGEVIHHFIPLPIPASIYGMLLLFLLLEVRIVKPEHIRETCTFLIQAMPIMFIPPGVGLLEKWGYIDDIWLPLIAALAISTIVVMAISGWVTQLVNRAIHKKDQEELS
ncbi:MAG: CidA/LrgA family protein [Lachnospiraceae bacterium]|nr:CidA/LrgA family protein [Lachnospiraceae bacterium]